MFLGCVWYVNIVNIYSSVLQRPALSSVFTGPVWTLNCLYWSFAANLSWTASPDKIVIEHFKFAYQGDGVWWVIMVLIMEDQNKIFIRLSRGEQSSHLRGLGVLICKCYAGAD